MAYQPKSYRKFLAGTVTAAVVASAVTPAAAADTTFQDVENLDAETKAAINALVDAGVITGYGDGTFKPFNDINRGQVAKMIVRYLDLELPTESAGVFADLSADSEFVLYAEALYNAEIVSGVPQEDGTITFGAGDPLTREQMAKILVNALDLEGTGEEVNVKDLSEAAADQREYIQILAQRGLTTLPGGEFNPKDTVKRSQLALFLYRAGIEEPVVTPEVTGVSAINLKQVEVKFNTEVDKATAETLTNYKYTTTAGSASLTSGSAKLQADGKTVVLTFGTEAAQQEAGKVEVKNVKDAKGTTVKTSSQDVKFFDSTVPVVEGVTLTGPRTVELEFSEVLKTAPTVKLGNGSISAFATLKNDGKTAVVEFGLAPTEGQHELTISGGADYANYAIEQVVKTFDYKVDTTAPTVTVDEAKPNQVTLKFSKPVQVKAAGNVSVYHTINNSGSYVGSALTPVDAVNGYTDEYVVTFATPLREGSTTVFLNTKENALEDAWGNDVASTELTATVVLDKTAPTATVTSTEDSKFEVVFSEEVELADVTNPANFSLKDPEGKTVSLATAGFSYNNTTKKLTITLGTDLKAGTYQLTIKDIKDRALVANKLVETTHNVVVTDTTPWGVAKFESAGTGKVRVTFNEAMSDEGLTDLSNYEFVTNADAVVAFPTGTKVTKLDSKNVLITMGDVNEDGNPDAVPGTVTNVRVNGKLKDAAGNAQTTLFVKSPALTTADIAAANLDDVVVASSRTITFTVDNDLVGALNPANFTLGSGKVVGGASYVNKGGEATVTLTLRADQTNFAPNGGDTVTIAAGALENRLGDKNSAIIAAVTADNAIKPSVAKVGNELNIAQTAEDTITIVFNESLTETNETLYAHDLVLTDAENKELVPGVDYTTDVVNGTATNLEIIFLTTKYTTDYSGPISIGSKSTVTYIADADTLANKADAFSAKLVAYKADFTAPAAPVVSATSGFTTVQGAVTTAGATETVDLVVGSTNSGLTEGVTLQYKVADAAPAANVNPDGTRTVASDVAANTLIFDEIVVGTSKVWVRAVDASGNASAWVDFGVAK